MEYQCKQCQKTFSVKPSARRDYCARACYSKARKERAEQDALTCETCGKKYLRTHKDRPSRFCSNKCQGEHSTKERGIVVCKGCQQPFQVKPYLVKEQTFCSHSCRGKFYCQWVKAERKTSPTYYDKPYWKRQSVKARRRDGHKCQDCGAQFQKGTKLLHVHHKVPVRLGGSDHLDNLISLCASCHRRADAALRTVV